MRKSIIATAGATQSNQPAWLDLARLAKVEITSEDDLFPIEHALGQALSTGWRAAAPGPQIIRILFDHPVDIKRIHVHIVERAAERTQEFALFAESEGAGPREIRRQQFTFSPHGSTEEIEDFAVELSHVTSLELRIDPDRSHDPSLSQSFATLAAFKVA